jgi:hypothetical protein
MTKIFKRKLAAVLLSVAMAAVLFAGFGTPAWAAGDEDVTVSVAVYWDDYNPDVPFGITDVTIDKSTFTLADAYWWITPDADEYYGPNVFNPVYHPTVFDASSEAFAWFTAENIGYWGGEQSIDWDWDKSLQEDETYELRGVWVDGIWDVYAEMTDYDEDYWYGYAWILYVNGIKANLYSSNIELSDDMEIEWRYQYTVTPLEP